MTDKISNKITKIVLTGGPCAGKTTAMARIIEHFSSLGFQVFAIPEVPTMFSSAGINYLTHNKALFFEAEKSTLNIQLALEDHFAKMAAQCSKPVLIVCDRGTMDISAYVSPELWEALTEEMGTNTVKLHPASVAFDTLSSAKANDADVVLIDTAGRLHNKVGLMNELKKIKDVMKKVLPEAPDEVMLVLDGSTGQNAFEQAKQFSAVTQITSLAITKLDGTAKGGVVIGISDQLKVPVKYIGLGEGMEDLQLFNKKQFVNSLFND